MASGNATFTYTGEESSITIQGVKFVQGEPTHVTDNGVISMIDDWDEFERQDDAAEPAPAPKAKPAKKAKG